MFRKLWNAINRRSVLTTVLCWVSSVVILFLAAVVWDFVFCLPREHKLFPLYFFTLSFPPIAMYFISFSHLFPWKFLHRNIYIVLFVSAIAMPIYFLAIW